MPLRTIHQPIPISDSHRRRSNYWSVYSIKANRPIELFSDLEYSHWLLMECNPEVISLCEKPLELSIGQGANKIRRVFDLWLQWRSGLTEYVSVVRSDKLVPTNHNQLLPARWKEISDWARAHGTVVRFVADDTLYQSKTRLTNYRLLYPYVMQSQARRSKDLLASIVGLVTRRQNIRLQEVLDAMPPPVTDTLEHCFQAIYEGAVEVELDKSVLSRQSLLRAVDHE